MAFLVVEDDSFQAWALEQLLVRAGAGRVECAANGIGALRALQRERFDMLVCDLDMPGMDGIELIAQVGTLADAPAVLVCTSHDQPLIAAVEGIARERGIRLLGAISKPVTARKLAEAIAMHATAPAARVAEAADVPVTRAALAAALEREQIRAWFQPKIDLATGRLAGAEALARWPLAGGAVLAPAHFMCAVERERMMPALTRLVARQAMSACAAWRREGIRTTVSVNVGTAALADPAFVDTLSAEVGAHGLCSGDVILEVTESAAAAYSPPDVETLTRLRMRGFGLAIDDFGTGFSSMLQLARLPFSEIKIDRRFVQAAARHRTCRAVVRSCADMAGSLGMKSVAEGVETQAEWRLMRELGCGAAQGWLFGKAMPPARFAAFARTLRETPARLREAP